MVVAASCYGGCFSVAGTGETCEDRGNNEWSQIQENPWGEPASECKRPQIAANVEVLEWPSQSPDLNPIENLRKDLKIAVHRRSPSNLTELDQICKEEWEKLPKSRWGKFIRDIPKKMRSCNHCQRCFYKVFTQGVEYLLMQDLSAFHF